MAIFSNGGGKGGGGGPERILHYFSSSFKNSFQLVKVMKTKESNVHDDMAKCFPSYENNQKSSSGVSAQLIRKIRNF